MIFGVGIDLVSVDRIQNLMLKFGEKFLEKIFTANEITQASKIAIIEENFLPRAIFFAKRFAAKEAFSKAMGLGIGRGVDFRDIEVVNNELGCPKINLLNGKENFVMKYFNCKSFAINLSLSDEKPMAAAVVIISAS